MIDLSDYYSGGYFLIRADKPTWPQLQTDLLPEKLLSLSGHICPRLKVYWGWTPGDRETALRFGIPEDKWAEFVEWCRTGYLADLDVVSMFYSPEAARRFVERFLPNTANLYLIGTGLHKSSEEMNWRNPSEGRVEGIEKQIEQHLPLIKCGTALGFEVVSLSYNDYGCSWYCNHTAEDLGTLFDIRPGQYGLIETREAAQHINDWIAEAPGSRGEPEPYDYWLLVSYPLTD
ncbi:MAG: hypothetical protein GC204_09500 [Chloroflexi bacterium]|nr:hypothetical protein [Chloroflexota bacterium]